MRLLHLFFPENDLALAQNLDNYTPPPAAVKLRMAGEALPMWYGNEGDRFVASGINGAWVKKMNDLFGLDILPFDYQPANYRPAPWGWSKASCRVFSKLGFTSAQLPCALKLEKMRQLSHRRTAAAIGVRLVEQGIEGITAPACELRTIEELRAFTDKNTHAIFKLPWSSSGRGIIPADKNTFTKLMPQLEGMIQRQGSVLAEAKLDKRTDFAMLFNMEAGKASFAGLSLFQTDGFAAYAGNILLPQELIEQRICAECSSTTFHAVKNALPPILEEIIGTDYDGPLGIDMLTCNDGTLAPAIELNLRMTMGHLCLELYRRHVQTGAEGLFTISTTQAKTEPVVANRRLTAGSLPLTPPGGEYSFTVTLKS